LDKVRKWKKLFEKHIKFFKQQIRKYGYIDPALIMIKGKNLCFITLDSRESFDMMISNFKPDAYMFFATAWSKDMTPESLKSYKLGDIEKSEDKQEVLACLLVSADKRIMKVIPIERKGEKVRFGKAITAEGPKIGGRFVKDVKDISKVDYIV